MQKDVRVDRYLVTYCVVYLSSSQVYLDQKCSYQMRVFVVCCLNSWRQDVFIYPEPVQCRPTVYITCDITTKRSLGVALRINIDTPVSFKG